MGKESPTLQYKIAQDGYDPISLGVSLLPKEQVAIVTSGDQTCQVPLKRKDCLLKRNDEIVGGVEVSIEVDTPFEQSLTLPLFYFANYSFLGFPTPDLHPEISERMIRPDRNVTRLKDVDKLQQALNLVTVLRASLYCQQHARIKV